MVSLPDWIDDQELTVYNELNDEVMTILHHQRIRDGFRPDEMQQQRYLQVLYDIDSFRLDIDTNELDDIGLLRKAIDLLTNELFK